MARANTVRATALAFHKNFRFRQELMLGDSFQRNGKLPLGKLVPEAYHKRRMESNGKQMLSRQSPGPRAVARPGIRPLTYLPTTRTPKLSGRTGGRPFLPSLASGAGPYSAASRY